MLTVTLLITWSGQCFSECRSRRVLSNCLIVFKYFRRFHQMHTSKKQWNYLLSNEPIFPKGETRRSRLLSIQSYWDQCESESNLVNDDNSVKRRFQWARRSEKKREKHLRSIATRYFFSSGVNSGSRRNCAICCAYVWLVNEAMLAKSANGSFDESPTSFSALR